MEKLPTHQPPTTRQRRSASWKWCLLFVPILTLTYWRTPTINFMISSFDLHNILLSVPSGQYARSWSTYYTSETHLAGQGLDQAEWTEARWKEFGIPDTHISSHDTEVPLPRGNQRVALLDGDKVEYVAPMVDGPASEDKGFVSALFGFSANANITADYVYCNFASEEDFQEMEEHNVNVTGKIGIAKLANASPYLRERGLESFRAAQVFNAERAGLIGLILYTDPMNDGPLLEWNGYKPYPHGVARPPTAIERGGLGNAEDFHRGLLAKIPCIPVSYADAIRLMAPLNGVGPSSRKHMSDRWQGGELMYYGVGYHLGPSPGQLKINIVNDVDLVPSKVQNVIGTIPGSMSDEVVIIGNHRDAWGPGAGDPGSGSAALNEVVRSFGEAYRRGWRPHRTLVFASFEGEEFAQIGSSLWIEKNLQHLKATTVAYLNVVVAASGSKFHAKTTPLLYRAVQAATSLVPSPNQTVPHQTVRDVWGGDFGTPGSGDANPFLGHLCVSTVDVGFSPYLGEKVFPYHTGFDTFEWMDEIGDPEWEYHVTSARILSLMAAHLTEPAVLDVSVGDYAVALRKWVQELCSSKLCAQEVDMTDITDAVDRLSQAAKAFDSYAESLRASKRSWWKPLSAWDWDLKVRRANKVYLEFERQFFHAPGIDSDSNFHHALFAPSAWHSNPPPLAGLSRSLAKENWENAKKWKDVMADKIMDAANLLEYNLSVIDKQTFPGP